MRQAVIFIDRLDAPPARRTASADAQSRYPRGSPSLRSNAFRREVPSHKVVLHAPWRVARRARSNSHDSLGVGYRSKIPASIRLRDILMLVGNRSESIVERLGITHAISHTSPEPCLESCPKMVTALRCSRP